MNENEKSFSRIHATDEERKEMQSNWDRIGRFRYEAYEYLMTKARSKEEYDFYEDLAHSAFKNYEALEFGP